MSGFVRLRRAWKSPTFWTKYRLTTIATSTLKGSTLDPVDSWALAQDYPNKTVKIIVPFGAGGPADVTARQIGSILQENFGQPFVIELRPDLAPKTVARMKELTRQHFFDGTNPGNGLFCKIECQGDRSC